MHPRRTPPTGRHRTKDQEGSLKQVTFVGSFPTADFRVTPSLPEVALIGRSNVGKSSLLNALVGRKALARTSKTPGKTRDCNVYNVPDQCYLVDLPGYGYARAPKGERQRFGRLIDQYLSTRATLAGVVWLLDVRRDPSDHDLELAARLADWGVPILVAITKGDKVGQSQRASRTHAILHTLGLPSDQGVVTSAVTGEGVPDLRDSILALSTAARQTP